MKKNLIFSGGIFHPFDDTSKTLSTIINSFGYDSEIMVDIEEGIRNIDKYDLITFNALRWRMLNHEKYLPYIDEWQFSLSEEGQKNLYNYMMSGGLLIAYIPLIILALKFHAGKAEIFFPTQSGIDQS